MFILKINQDAEHYFENESTLKDFKIKLENLFLEIPTNKWIQANSTLQIKLPHEDISLINFITLISQQLLEKYKKIEEFATFTDKKFNDKPIVKEILIKVANANYLKVNEIKEELLSSLIGKTLQKSIALTMIRMIILIK